MSRLRQAAAWLTGAFLLTACGGSPSGGGPSPAASGRPEKASVKIAVGGQGQIVYLPLTLAGELGYFKAEGLDVEIDNVKGEADALKALTGGSADVVTGFYENAIRAQAQGKQIEMIALCDLAPGLVLLVNKKHQDARSVKDLASLNIGVTSLGSSTDEMVRYLFKANGLDPKTARTVGVGSGGPALTALKSDTVQALATVEPAASSLEQSGEGKAIYDTRTPAGTADVFGGAWPAGGFYLNADFVKQNPRTARALARVAVRTLRYIHSHTAAEIAAQLPAQVFYTDGNRDAFARVLEANLGLFSTDGRMPAEGPDNVLKTLKAADPSTDWSTVDLKKTYDNTFVSAVR